MSHPSLLTVGQMAKRFKLARTTLLYYECIGLLVPLNRSAANYRLYDSTDVERLKKIKLYRLAGITLSQIIPLVESKHSDGQVLFRKDVLETRLEHINDEIAALRIQQSIIVSLINDESVRKKSRLMSKETWVDILQKAGLDESGMSEWHRQFEQSAPETHQDFLESLGLEPREIIDIRTRSK
ncbi:MAG: MerR family transcriptional regulator [Kangiellaceae bacterium]|nr:MerR family transcriptional regulator [Kangiellaceae bacterium]